MSDERSGTHAAYRTANLQPDMDALARARLRPGGTAGEFVYSERAVLAELGRGLIADNDAEAIAMRRAAENLARRAVDAVLYDRVKAAGFAGFEYKALVSDLIAYAMPTVKSWLRRGTIFGKCAQIGRPVGCADRERDQLARSPDDREELAIETIAEALKLFRGQAVAGKGWSATGGAALSTFFVGACLQCFPNVWRRWRAEQPDHRAHDHLDLAEEFDRAARRVLDPRITDDPADIVASQQLVRDVLAAMPQHVREVVVLLIVHDHTYAEIAEKLGTTAGAVEQKVRRVRHEIQRRQEKRGFRDQPNHA